MVRVVVVAAVLLASFFALRHPAPQTFPAAAASPKAPHSFHERAALRTVDDAEVYVAGAVARPGVYRIPLGGRVAQAVARAGGMLPDADTLAVNLAARVSDGDEVAVTRIGEAPLASHVRSKTHRTRRSHRHPSKTAPEAVDINTADVSALESVPGIGPALAERIVAIRNSEGSFTSFDQLLDVSGMTSSRLDRVRAFLTL